MRRQLIRLLQFYIMYYKNRENVPWREGDVNICYCMQTIVAVITKNWFVLWYRYWRVLLGRYKRVDLYFLVAGHTNNVCDGAFGHVKRRLQHRDAHVTADVMQIINESSVSTRFVPSQDVEWRN